MDNLVSTVKELISYDYESDWFEFKENWYEPNQIGEYISSISNVVAMRGLDYGYLIWGVNNKSHKLVGTDFDFHRDVNNEPLEHYLARMLNPDMAFEFKEISINKKRIVVLVIPSAKQIPTSFNGNRYFRIGSSKVNLNKYPERETMLFRVLGKVSALENDENRNQDLTFKKLFAYYGYKGITLNSKNFKKNLNLLTKEGTYNKLAGLLADENQISMRVSIFSGKDKASKLFAVREFGNTCLLTALDKIIEYGDVINIPQADERNRIVERKEVMLFNESAFREAVINAFVHNDWEDNNAPMISVFSDRIEILSRGGIPRGQTIKGFFAGNSVPVNKELAQIFLQLHISERSGRGVPKIVEIYGKKAYEFQENYIVVTIPFSRVGDDERDNNIELVSNKKLGLNSICEAILSIMRDNPNVTHKQLVMEIGVGKTTIYKNINLLKDNKYIERMGSDKKGWWKVLV